MSSLSVVDAARDAPEVPALIVGPRVTTYRELAARVARRARWLEDHGAPFDDGGRVSIVGTSHPDTIETVLAAIELGQALVLVHPRLTRSEKDAIVETALPRLHFEEAPREAELPAAPPRGAQGAIDPERPLAILFTSGTTGRPRGVVLSRRAFVASAAASAANLGWREDDRWLLGLPIAHVGGLSILTRCLLARRTVVVPRAAEAGQRLDTDSLAEELAEQRVTLASLVPTQLEWLLARQPRWVPPQHLRAVLLGGAAAHPALLARAAERGVPVLTTYGLTEACSQVTTQPSGTTNLGELGSGAPAAGVEVRIVDGAIQVRGPTLLSGLFPATAESPVDADGWLHTEDLGRFGEDGMLHVLGRRSDLIITGGENVHPSEVESVLERHPGVQSACVFGVPDATWGQIVAAAIVPVQAGAPAPRELARFVAEHLAPHRRPRRVAFVAAFETTRAGKLDRGATSRYVMTKLEPLA